MIPVNETHDPKLRSWVTSANGPDTDFPIQNLPFAIFRRAARTGTGAGSGTATGSGTGAGSGTDAGETFRGGVAIGDQILDLRAARDCALFDEPTRALLSVCSEPTLNPLMALGQEASSRLRSSLSKVLRDGSAGALELAADLVPQSDAEFSLPAVIGDYTDFYASIHHATTVGRQLRPDEPLLPNYRWIPIAYHGRSSSIGVSEHTFPRPVGQRFAKGAAAPDVGPTRRLDFELELGIFIGRGNAQGRAIPIADAESHVFGLCLLNDWSARDVQGFEYQPLGPFLGKNFATTISPWVVTLEALAPFRLPFTRASTEPQPLPYLEHPQMRATGALDIALEVALETPQMRAAGQVPEVLARSNFRHAYWTVAQMIAHHTVNGCNLRPGDLLGSGTMSGPSAAEAGSLLELTAGGRQPLSLASAETRAFLEDGDRVELRAWCERDGCARIGFGTASGMVLPAA